MKLSKNTIDALKNFSTINKSLLFLKGKTQSTISPMGVIFANVEIDEDIPQEFGIFELSQFLGVLTSFNDPEIKFEDSYLVLSEGKETIKYFFGNPNSIKSPKKDKKIVIDPSSIDVELTLAKDELTSLLKKSALLGLEKLVFSGNGEKIIVSCLNPNNKTSNEVSFEIGDTTKEFSHRINIENLKIMYDNYDLVISNTGIVHMKSKDRKIEYWLTCEIDD